MKFIICLTLCLSAGFTLAQNYCGLKSCSNTAHLACNHRGWASTCPPYRRTVTLADFQRDLILDLHNANRNKIALGRERGFSPATRMATMDWDNELARMASLNVMQCLSRYDVLCADTLRFNKPGQNIAISFSTAPNAENEPVATIARNFIGSWYSEVNKANQNTITRCCGNARHFTQMIQARADRVGCALAILKSNTLTTKIFTCNYSVGNSSPVYIAGPTASKCTRGRNPQFTGLCHPTERV